MNYPTGVELHNGKIRISFTYRGIRCREVLKGWAATSGNIKKAGNLRASIVGDIQLGQFDYAARFPDSKALRKFSTTIRVKTFHELCSIFLESKTYEISQASHNTLSSMITTLCSVVGGETQIADITHVDLLNYRNNLLTGEVINSRSPWLSKTGRAVSTVNGLMNVLTALLKLAFRSKYITHMPYEGIRALKRSRNDPDPLLHGEYIAFIAALSAPAAILWTVAIHSGLRHGEICSLSWEDVDLDAGEIHVKRNMTNRGQFVPPKTAAGERTITLVQPALLALREQFRKTGALSKKKITFHHREYGRTEEQNLRFVFVPDSRSRTKTGHYGKNSLAYSWDRGLKKAGLRARVPYQSRHTFACWLLTAGANPSFIANQMGHENAKMVYEIYSKWIVDMNQNQVDLMNSKLPTALPPSCPGDNLLIMK